MILAIAGGPHTPQDRSDLPPYYQPKHKGSFDIGTGLYTREDEDIIVAGDPSLILRRTYLSGYHVSRQFGIGTTHNGEIYLYGDFQRVSIIQPKGYRIAFERMPGAESPFSATYIHSSGPEEWVGAQMRFALFGWKVLRRDGSELTFQGCGGGTTCSIIQSRDARGKIIDYRRDLSGRLTRMHSGDRWIAFEYDTRGRVTHASASTGKAVDYQYDAAGRLWQVFADDGRVHRYRYTERDELATIWDPGTTIENYYDANGRVIRQVNRYPGDPEPLIFTASYELNGKDVIAAEITRSDGQSTSYTFDEGHNATSERFSFEGQHLVTLTYDRNSDTKVTAAIIATCHAVGGTPTSSRIAVVGGDVERARDEGKAACLALLR